MQVYNAFSSDSCGYDGSDNAQQIQNLLCNAYKKICLLKKKLKFKANR